MSTAVQEQDQRPAQGTELGEGTTETTALSRTGAMGFGLVPRNFDEGWRMATVFAKSALVPKNYQGAPEDILIAMQYGAEIGLPPMASLQSVAVINGKPGVYGDGFLGVIMSKPAYLRHVEYYELPDGTHVRSLRQADYAQDDTKAVSLFWRRGNPEPFVGEFSIGDAKRAKLWGKEGPWSQYPARQLMWRARGFAGRNGFAGELRGVKMAEELLDYPNELETADVPMPVVEPVRRSEKGTTAAASPTLTPDDDPTLTNELPEPRAAVSSTPASSNGASSHGRAATRPAAPTAAAASSQTSTSMVITNFQYVTPKGQDPYYEIAATVKRQGASPVAMTFVTRDEQMAKLAATCEGSEALFDLTWHTGKQANGKPCKVLDAIVATH